VSADNPSDFSDIQNTGGGKRRCPLWVTTTSALPPKADGPANIPAELTFAANFAKLPESFKKS
jgi:hypothetical protein